MIKTKQDMYTALTLGAFGNTIPQFFSVEAWEDSPDSKRYKMWGVRSARQSMHPACRLNVPREDVAAYARQHFADGPNISMMVDAVAGVTAWLEIFESTDGLVVEGIQYPDIAGGWNWRNSMREPSRRKSWRGIQAKTLLAWHLNSNSLHDLYDVLEAYSGHVVELSALDRCIGTVPHRNAIVWETRNY